MTWNCALIFNERPTIYVAKWSQRRWISFSLFFFFAVSFPLYKHDRVVFFFFFFSHFRSKMRWSSVLTWEQFAWRNVLRYNGANFFSGRDIKVVGFFFFLVSLYFDVKRETLTGCGCQVAPSSCLTTSTFSAVAPVDVFFHIPLKSSRYTWLPLKRKGRKKNKKTQNTNPWNGRQTFKCLSLAVVLLTREAFEPVKRLWVQRAQRLHLLLNRMQATDST